MRHHWTKDVQRLKLSPIKINFFLFFFLHQKNMTKNFEIYSTNTDRLSFSGGYDYKAENKSDNFGNG